MHHTRLIARLDVKAPFLIKGINLEGVRTVSYTHLTLTTTPYV